MTLSTVRPPRDGPPSCVVLSPRRAGADSASGCSSCTSCPLLQDAEGQDVRDVGTPSPAEVTSPTSFRMTTRAHT